MYLGRKTGKGELGGARLPETGCVGSAPHSRRSRASSSSSSTGTLRCSSCGCAKENAPTWEPTRNARDALATGGLRSRRVTARESTAAPYCGRIPSQFIT